jgi:hypothetical protein
MVTSFIRANKRRTARLCFRPLNGYSSHLVERYLISPAVIELGRARTLVRRHGLSVLASRFQIGRYPRGAEGMAADPGARAELGGAAPAADSLVCRVMHVSFATKEVMHVSF